MKQINLFRLFPIELQLTCVRNAITQEWGKGTPEPFNICTNNCRDNSERVISKCGAKLGKMTNNPDDSTWIERFYNDWIVAPPQYYRQYRAQNPK